ncbi:MAG: hypothetical protein ACYDG2_24630, partial [Ruminiclostridium sp.]
MSEIPRSIDMLNLWSSFEREIIYKNRFFINHKILDYIKIFSENNCLLYDENKVLYRARIFTGDKS